MSKKMLIDASHPEETRVVIVDHNRVEELDFESRHKRQLRGNVYLARVTRVEPSLQAAFIEYGGNKHGFLAFSEIHPDYYQIPYEDRMAILEAEEEEHNEDADEESEDDSDEEERDENLDPDHEDAADETDLEVADEQVKVASTRRKRMSRRRYKIQEVIKRGQILLVQAVKEERGNKGAAMTSYLSLAGRYCVLMPNTPRGGGISRKIANGSDRKRLKSVMSELEVPQGMGVIVRTAGAKRTKAEIKRDYEYLSRLWGDIRETTLKSVAPALIHEEGNLVKRSIRDLYNKDIDEVLVEGESAYKNAKAFIKMLMPSHAKFVKQYKEDIPLFLRYGVERQIEDSLSPVVQLKSGGYLVIHPTEALVSVDVNSGRSTKERNVERTAVKTNIEAAQEVARQMRLRDLAGLIVIDFIDMDENKNNRAVERKMKEALTQDRARIQTSRISQFGLMEISRQRRRRSLLEGSTTSCPHCEGVGRKRTIESSALAAIRAVEETAARGEADRIRLNVSTDVALYLINEKRDLLTQVDKSGGVFTEVVPDEELIRPHYNLEVVEKKRREGPDPLEEIEKEFRRERQKAANAPKKKAKETADEEDESDAPEAEQSEQQEGEGSRKRRNRRGRRGGRGRGKGRNEDQNNETSEDDTQSQSEAKTSEDDNSEQNNEAKKEGKKPRRRGGRRKAPSRDGGSDKSNDASSEDTSNGVEESKNEKEAPKAKSSRRRKAPSKSKPEEVETAKDETPVEETKPKRAVKGTRRKAPSRKPVDAEQSEDKPKAKRSRKAPAKSKAADKSDSEQSVSGTPKAKKAKAPASKRTRKAPTRKSSTPDEVSEQKSPAKAKAETKEAAPKSSRRRAAPKKPKTNDDSAAATSESKAPRKRKAPARKPKADSEADVKTTAAKTKKAPVRKAAPKKAATKKAAPKKAAAKKPAAKKTPAKMAEPKAEKEPKAKAASTAPRRKAAPKKAAPKTESVTENKTESASKPADSPKVDSTVEKPKKKKRGWFGLKK